MAVRWYRDVADPYRGEARQPAQYTPGWWNMPEPEAPVQIRPRTIAAQPNWAGAAAMDAGGGYPGTPAPRRVGPSTTPGPAAAQGGYVPQGAGRPPGGTMAEVGGMYGQYGAAQAPQGPQGTRARAAAGQDQQQYKPAPRGVPAGWYRAFQEEHGQTPEQFYGRTGEGMDEALADKGWGEQFAMERGRAPNQTEWENHWYNTRRGGRPTFSRDQWKVLRRYQRKSRGESTGERRAPRPQVISEDPRWRVEAFG